MKKSIWLLVVVFVIAGGMYTYVFFAGQKETRASITTPCCSEVTATDIQAGSVENPCANICSDVISSCPPITTTTPPATNLPPTKSTLEEKPTNVPCDNCVCGTEEECPNEEKCDECLEEENHQEGNGKRDGSGNGSGNGNHGKNRNERK